MILLVVFFLFYFEIGYIRLIWIKINILVMINNKIYYILLNLCISRSELRGVIYFNVSIYLLIICLILCE